MNHSFNLPRQVDLKETPYAYHPQKGIIIITDSQWDKLRDKRNYVSLSVERRRELIEAVLEQEIPIKEASQLLDINYSTAKHIIKLYKKTGQIETN